MNQSRVRVIASEMGWTPKAIAKMIDQHRIPPLADRTEHDWLMIEHLLSYPLGIEMNGWTYFEPYDVVCQLVEDKGDQCVIKCSGLPPKKVLRSLLAHPFSEKAGGHRRWNLTQRHATGDRRSIQSG